MSSLKVLNIVNVLNAGVRCAFGNVYLCCIIVMFLLITSIKTKTLTKGAYRARNYLSWVKMDKPCHQVLLFSQIEWS